MPEGRKVGVMGQRGGKGLLHIPGDSPISEAYEKSRRFQAGSGVLGHLSDSGNDSYPEVGAWSSSKPRFRNIYLSGHGLL